MTRPSEPRTPRLYHAFSPGLALGLAITAWVSMLGVGSLLLRAGAPLHVAMATGQLAMLVPPALALWLVPRPPAAIGLTRPRAPLLVGAVLVGATAWYLNLRLVELLEIPTGDGRLFDQLVEVPSLWGVLLAVAVVPAICEEVVFRGVLLRAFAARLPPAAAVIGSAAIFAIYHVRPIQMLPTFTLGVVFAVIALRGRSIVPSVLAHFLNNALALIVARGELPALTAAMETRSPLVLGGFAVACGAGVWVVARR